jgi:type IV secretory pathway VirB10-like protein
MSEEHDKLDLTLMPGGSREQQMRAGVRTVNAKPMMVAGGLVVGVTVLIGSIMMGRNAPAPNKGAARAAQTEKASAMQQAASVVGDAKEGTEVPWAGAPPQAAPAQTGAAAVGAPGDLDEPPSPSSVPVGSADGSAPLLRPGQAAPGAAAARDGVRQADQRSQDVQNQRMVAFLDALKAPPKATSAASGGLLQKVQNILPMPGGVLGSAAPAAGGGLSDQEKLTALQQLMGRQAAAGIEPSAAAKAEYARLTGQPLGSKAQGGYESFDNQNDGGDRWASTSRPEAPVSPFELRAGFVIPGVMITGVSSELPGQIEAQVAQNVFDTATGGYLLIPQGSRLVGSYQSNAAYGQARVLIAWQRVVFPDGKALDIGAMPGADSAGYAGFHDQVNNHYTRIFGSAVMLSLIGAGAQVGSPQTSTLGTTTTVSQALSQQLAQQLGATATQMIQKNLSIAPTLKIRPGYRFNVVVTKDLVFQSPYRAFDYRGGR